MGARPALHDRSTVFSGQQLAAAPDHGALPAFALVCLGRFEAPGSKSGEFQVWGNSKRGCDCSTSEFNSPTLSYCLTPGSPQQPFTSHLSPFCGRDCWGWLASPSSHFPSKLRHPATDSLPCGWSWGLGPGDALMPALGCRWRLLTCVQPQVVSHLGEAGSPSAAGTRGRGLRGPFPEEG